MECEIRSTKNSARYKIQERVGDCYFCVPNPDKRCKDKNVNRIS